MVATADRHLPTSQKLLTSDLGRIFFKSLAGNRYKVKAAAAVAASKEQWCNNLQGEEEW